jgi:site-specific recombinase XerD
MPPAWEQAVEDWRHDQQAEGRPASTIGKRTKHLRQFVATSGHRDPFAVTTADLVGWLSAQPWEANTATIFRSTFRAFYAWAVATGRAQDNPALYLSRVASGTQPAPLRVLGARGPLPDPVPTLWESALRLFIREQRASGNSAQTIALRVRHLARVGHALQPLGPFDVTFYDLVEWMAARIWAVETRRSYRSSLRVFYAWAVAAEHMVTDPAAKLPKTGVSKPNPHPASETAVYFAILTATPAERVMVRLAAEVGLRRAEVAKVHSRDLFEGTGGWSLLVHGKGAHDRLVPLPDELASELRNLPPGYVFPGQVNGHLSPRWVGKRVSRLLPEGVTTHALRHRFATRAYALEKDVFTVQQLLGHASPVTTRRYVAVDQEQLRSTVQTLAATTTRAARPAMLGSL